VLSGYRDFLRGIARRRLIGRLQQRVDASDLVQETMLEAHRNAGEVFGRGDSGARAALVRILRCNIANAVRDHCTAKCREVGREASLPDGVELAGSRVGTPSLDFARREMAAKFFALLERLPPDQADALRLRYFEGRSVQEIAEALGRSRVAAAGLLKRGLEQMRTALAGEESLWAAK
jgi:RNA polymerase sigma-70 factor (ECF subfamily)